MWRYQPLYSVHVQACTLVARTTANGALGIGALVNGALDNGALGNGALVRVEQDEASATFAVRDLSSRYCRICPTAGTGESSGPRVLKNLDLHWY